MKTAGNGTSKVSMLRGSVFTHSLLEKVLDLAISYPKDQTAPPSRHAKPAFPLPARPASRASPPKNSSNINLGSRIA